MAVNPFQPWIAELAAEAFTSTNALSDFIRQQRGGQMATKKKSAVKKTVRRKAPVWTAEQAKAVREALLVVEGATGPLWDRVLEAEDVTDVADEEEDW